MERRNWTRSELIIAFNLYCKIPFGRIHNRNPQIVELAKALGRTPSALSWKLANFARLDPSLHSRNIAGAGHGAKLEEEVWQEFNHDWNALAFESERLTAELFEKPIEPTDDGTFPEGKTREALVRVRVNQSFFRAAILAAYGGKCCVTGLAVADLLSASHIVPWSVDIPNRTNPRNGLCLNALHDRAFDRGLMKISGDYRVELSPSLSKLDNSAVVGMLLPYQGVRINLPARFLPDPSFLQYHAEHVFRSIA